MNANALRGALPPIRQTAEAIDVARNRVVRFIGAPKAQDVVMCRNASEALNIVAKAFAPTVLEPGDEVCITIMEHHSNLIPWQACRAAGAKIVHLPRREQHYHARRNGCEKSARRRRFSCVHVSNVLASKPRQELGRRVHRAGRLLGVDGCPVGAAREGRRNRNGCDFGVLRHTSSLALLKRACWGKDELFNAMPPFPTGGEMIDNVTEQDATWAPVLEKSGGHARRGRHLRHRCSRRLRRIGIDAIEAREVLFVAYCMEEPSKLGFVTIISHPNADIRTMAS